MKRDCRRGDLMLHKEVDLVSTAYSDEAAKQYNARRFTTKQGLAFASLELGELERVVAQVPRGAYVLEVGCGTGRFSLYLGNHGYRIRAVDPSSEMIRIASEKSVEFDNVTFAQEEGASLSTSDSTYDLAFSIRVTNQTESEVYALRMIREMIRVTKPGGLVLVEFVNKQRPFPKKSKDVRLSFSQITKVAYESNCRVESRRGILVFSQTVLNRIPNFLVPVWALVERISSRILWKWASRGYVLLRKQ